MVTQVREEGRRKCSWKLRRELRHVKAAEVMGEVEDLVGKQSTGGLLIMGWLD